MDNVIPIILTGAGCPGIAGTIYSLRNNPDNQKFKIFTTDINRHAVGQYLSDGFKVVPDPFVSENAYIDIMLKSYLK